MVEKRNLKVAVLGYGAIGKQVVAGLTDIPEVEFIGVVVRRPGSATGHKEISLEEAIGVADLIVESAGGEALRTHGPTIIAAGKDLLAVSYGQLVDEELRQKLLFDGPGKTYLSTGAVGGLDILRAATIGDGLEKATLISRKLPKALIQNWMDEKETKQILGTKEAITVFKGDIKEAIRLFPASLNIAIALAAATNLWEETIVELVADPNARLTKHVITASGDTGNYFFEIVNEPSKENPASSGVVAKALLKGVATIASPSGSFV